ncbi:MAG: ribonuclease D [Blastocatellia bacterium]
MKIGGMLDYTVEYIGERRSFAAVLERLSASDALAVDIETVNWWDRDAERVALIQMAFREGGRFRVAVIDPLAGLDLELLREPLEVSMKTKAIHNASFDAVKLARHYGIATSPIHDTMVAARRSGEKKCSLKALAEGHLGIAMDKAEQRSDWGRRPLSEKQLRYAALDAVCTLLLYERQIERGLRGEYQLRGQVERRITEKLPLSKPAPLPAPAAREQAPAAIVAPAVFSGELTPLGLSLLGIVAELDGRYSPEQLAVSIGSERIGLAGWIIDQMLGSAAEASVDLVDLNDGETIRREIAALCDRGLLRLSASRRLEATSLGASVWARNRLA